MHRKSRCYSRISTDPLADQPAGFVLKRESAIKGVSLMVHSGRQFVWILPAICSITLGPILLDTLLSGRSRAEAEGRREDVLHSIALKDVHPLHGGQNLYLRGDGTGFCQVIAWNANATNLLEKRYSLRSSPDSIKHFNILITPDSLSTFSTKDRAGLPDEAISTISVTWAAGRSLRISKWANDTHPAFDQIHGMLLTECQSAQKTMPIYEGKYDHGWVPDGF